MLSEFSWDLLFAYQNEHCLSTAGRRYAWFEGLFAETFKSQVGYKPLHDKSFSATMENSASALGHMNREK